WVVPAQEAGHPTDTLYGKMKELKGEAVSHNRVFKFYGTQLAELLPISKEVGAGLAGVFAGLGSGMWVMAAMEGVKIAMATFGEHTKEAEKAAEELRKKVKETALEIANLNRELMGQKKWSGVDVEFNAMSTLRTGAASWRSSAASETDPSERKLALNRAAEMEAEYFKLGGEQREAALKKQLELEEKLAEKKEEEKRATEAAAAAEKDRLLYLEAANKSEAELLKFRLSELNAPYEGFAKPGDSGDSLIFKNLEGLQKHDDLASKRRLDEAQQQGLTDAMSGQQEDSGQYSALVKSPTKILEEATKHATEAVKRFNEEGKRSQAVWVEVGASVASAFMSIGSAIGGQAGKVVSSLGEMIVKAITFAVAITEANSASMGPYGWVQGIAAGAAVLASIIGLTAGLSARAEGGPVMAGQPYLVGERGPEIVVPSSSGTVIPNHQLGGGGVTVNITAADASSFERMLRRNDTALLRVLRDASRNGRA
ncbi:MAG: hypothetical protein WCS72_16345, partial [Deltaproteobacteria bacterium]